MTTRPALHRRLTVRVVFFLTLALLPLGAIGILINQQLYEETRENAEQSLLALTEQAVSGESNLIVQTFGAAATLGDVISGFGDDIEGCRNLVREFMEQNARYQFAGFIDVDGLSRCSSASSEIDFGGPELEALLADPKSTVTVSSEGQVSAQNVLIVTQPRFQSGNLMGFASISLELDAVGAAFDFLGDAAPLALMTVNASGELLSTEQDRGTAEQYLPTDFLLDEMARNWTSTFVAVGANGETYLYSVVPIRPNVIYALGVWPESMNAGRPTGPLLNATLPLLMWVASLLVAWFVIDRFVLRGIRLLNSDMKRFATKRALPDDARSKASSDEFERLQGQFRTMAEDILLDQAELENRVHEKSILLKEVHHRVKNNLQIVSSIMNMQIRKATADETRVALRQIQDRIMGLSSVHRTLYQSENLNQVDASELIERLIEQTLTIGSARGIDRRVRTQLDSVILYPDQAVPLAMLVSEVLTNAMKYADSDEPDVEIVLSMEEDRLASLVISNSRSLSDPTDPAAGSDLGQQLIQAFAIQLGGRLETDSNGERYIMRTTFQVEDFSKDAIDY
ncbi:MAG: sensor histidine kinase [Pseudomonadota bacterium]